MTPEQREAIARADKTIEKGERLYRLRNRVSYMVGMLSLPDLEKLVGILDVLSEYELSMVARYAKGLADFRLTAQESEDAAGPPSTPQTDTEGSGS
jgi:hypothetical protein